jgi:hypothetical protein
LGATADRYTLCGTPEHVAPEIISNAGHGAGADWWVALPSFIAGHRRETASRL